MYRENKYEVFNTHALIKMVQNVHEAIEQEKVDHDGKDTTLAKKMRQDLNEMRYYLIKRLEGLDRTKSSFFPAGAIVIYRNPQTIIKPQFAKVVEYQDPADVDQKIIICFDGKEEWYKVPIEHLKLAYISNENQ